jgi:anti-sigma-K factor RskA
MKLARSRHLDALAGEYVLGTLRGAARRRFERAVREEPLVALRVRTLRAEFAPVYRETIAQTMPSDGWRRLQSELGLARFNVPWWRRANVWRAWALGTTAALILGIALIVMRPQGDTSLATIAQLTAPGGAASVTAALSRDGRTLELRAARPVVAGPAQSYELWLLPPGGAAPISLAVLGQLDSRIAVPSSQIGRLVAGSKLAVTVEPAGGSPTRTPTGPVILVGDIT